MDFNIVVDASIAVKWHIRNETYAASALDILFDYKTGKVGFIEPRLFYYETANAVHIAVQRKRITEDEGNDIIKDMLKIEMAVVDSPDMIRLAYDTAKKNNISVYDASYLITAKEHGTFFYTADQKFYNSIKEKEDIVKWIEDYKRAG